MATRKQKHAAALAKREKFMQTVKQGNLDVLRAEQTRRIEERKKLEEQIKERKIAKSKKLAEVHKLEKKGVQVHKPAPIDKFPRPLEA